MNRPMTTLQYVKHVSSRLKPRPMWLAFPIAMCLLATLSPSIASAQKGKGKKPGGNGNPHLVTLFDGSIEGEYDCTTLESWGFTQFSAPLAGGALDSGDFIQIDLASGISLYNCMWTVHKRAGEVQAVTFFFTTGGYGIHRTDEFPAIADGSTIRVRVDNVEVWKEKGSGKGTVAGCISVDDIVYVPVD